MVGRQRTTEHRPTWNRDVDISKGREWRRGWKRMERERERRGTESEGVASCLSLCLPLLWWWVYTGSTSPISKSVQGSAGAHNLATSCRCWLALWVSTTPPRDTTALVPSTCRSFSLFLSAAQIVSSPFRSISKFPSRFQRWLDVLRPLVARISNREAALSFLFSLPFLFSWPSRSPPSFSSLSTCNSPSRGC